MAQFIEQALHIHVDLLLLCQFEGRKYISAREVKDVVVEEKEVEVDLVEAAHSRRQVLALSDLLQQIV